MKKILTLFILTLIIVSCKKEWPNDAIHGCMDNTAFNYTPDANLPPLDTEYSENCCYITGCMDDLAFNYNSEACIDTININVFLNGSCCYFAGCTDPTAANYNPVACFDDGSCCYGTLGCTDPVALNYDALANCDDGSCIYPFTENFDSQFSNLFNQSMNDDFNWDWNTGETTSTDTGPLSGASGGSSDGYMYTEASLGNNPGKIAIIESNTINIGSAGNLYFKYHMWDDGSGDMGTLSIEINNTLVWSKSGNQGDQWNTAQVSLANYANSSITIKFIGTTGSGYQSDMAIDEVSISQ